MYRLFILLFIFACNNKEIKLNKNYFQKIDNRFIDSINNNILYTDSIFYLEGKGFRCLSLHYIDVYENVGDSLLFVNTITYSKIDIKTSNDIHGIKIKSNLDNPKKLDKKYLNYFFITRDSTDISALKISNKKYLIK
jgi:hypothetical protein